MTNLKKNPYSLIPVATTLGTNSLLLFSISFVLHCKSVESQIDRSSQIPVAILIHINDVYEIAAGAGRAGGLARVASLRNMLRKETPHVYILHAGDALSPSAIGAAKVKGERLSGKQMIAVLNVLQPDAVTFGNHEFDLNRKQFWKRMQESRFSWVSANTSDSRGRMLPGAVPYKILRPSIGAGRKLRIAIFGLTQSLNRRSYVRYADPVRSAQRMTKLLRKKSDLIVALTHQTIESDRSLARRVKGIDLILGGHEHHHIEEKGSPSIFRADANARSAYVHRIYYNAGGNRKAGGSRFYFRSSFVPLPVSIPEDAAIVREARLWLRRARAGLAGFDPEAPAAVTKMELDGRETMIRRESTELTRILAAGLRRAIPGADVALFNSGSIRIDDVIPAGKLSQYDILRILPFGGYAVSIRISGSVLLRLLRQGAANRGKGGYLQTSGVTHRDAHKGANTGEQNGTQGVGKHSVDDRYRINGVPLNVRRNYIVNINDFLLRGRERGMDFLDPRKGRVRVLKKGPDLRRILLKELRRREATYK